MKWSQEIWKVFKLLMINFYNIDYINSVILKRMKFITFKTFLEWKKREVNKKLMIGFWCTSFKEKKIKNLC